VKHNSVNVFQVDPSTEIHSWVGEQKLARAVIINGLREAAHSHQLCYRADALAWLLSDSTEPCSFLWWLAFLTDKPDDLADYIRRKVDLSTLKMRSTVDASLPEGAVDDTTKEHRFITEEHKQAISEANKKHWQARKLRQRLAGMEARRVQLAAKMNKKKSNT